MLNLNVIIVLDFDGDGGDTNVCVLGVLEECVDFGSTRK